MSDDPFIDYVKPKDNNMEPRDRITRGYGQEPSSAEPADPKDLKDLEHLNSLSPEDRAKLPALVKIGLGYSANQPEDQRTSPYRSLVTTGNKGKRNR